MIATLESLRDIGNTVIVVEHDEDTIRAADHIVEMGPGPGVHGGTVVVQGTIDDVLKCKASPTGQFLSGKRSIAMPKAAAQRQRQDADRPRRAREQPEVDRRDVSARTLIAITGASGSGKSTLDQRDSLQGALEAAGRYAHAARRARRRRRRRARAQGREHRPVADRPQQPLESGDLHRLLRHDPRSLHAGAALGRARLQSRAGSASTSRAAAARSARAKARSRRSSTSCPTSR